jgi:hypothetical protein
MGIGRLGINQEQFLKDCRERPEFFIENVLGCTTLYEKQVEICDALMAHRRVAISACYASGKTHLLGRLACWFWSSFPGSIVVMTSASELQLENALWAEFASAYKKAKYPLGGRLRRLQLNNPEDPKHYVVAVSTNEPEKIRGRHPDSGRILVLMDEASGISREIWDAIENLLNAEHAYCIAVTNPTKPTGPFYEAFTKGVWYPITISAFDTPNVKAGKTVVPGLCDPRWVEARTMDWGVNSNLYKTGVLGQFPDEGDDTLIPMNHIQAALEKRFVPEGEKVAGIDISRGGEDACVAVLKQGAVVTHIEGWKERDTMKTVNRIIDFMLEHNISPKNAWIDDGGVGGAVVDRLHEQGYAVRTVSFGAAAKSRNDIRFSNRRTEIFWKLRELFERGEIQIPNHTKLMRDLSSLRIDRKSNGKLHLVSKEILKRRGIPSPDYADALAMAAQAEHVTPTEQVITNEDIKAALRRKVQPRSWKERLKGKKWKGIRC